MSDFHLIRPEALFLFIPVIGALFFYQRKKKLTGQWQQLIHPKLQPYVLEQSTSNGTSNHWLTTTPIVIAAILGVIALSGPTWEKQDSPVYNSREGLVIALDLSLSMTAQDVAPSRLQRAKYKIIDVLESQPSAATALIAYSGDAHIASPLTQDMKTVESMLPALSPYMMPVSGSHLVRLAQQAADLFNQAQSNPRKLLLVTDGVEQKDIDQATRILQENNISLSILAIGTDQGAPIVKPDGSFFNDAQGNVIMPGLEWEQLVNLQDANDAKIARITNDDRDIQYLLNNQLQIGDYQKSEENSEFDQWHDAGYWLVLCLLPFALFIFRKGVIAAVVIGAFVMNSDQTWAEATDNAESSAIEASSSWLDWFRNDNQKGAARFDSSPAEAAQYFDDPKWKASSQYKSGDFESAGQAWNQFDDAISHYNRGNALAKQNKLDEALAAYDKALEQNPDFEDAQFNKNILEQIKKQQEQQSQNGDGDAQQQDGDSQNSQQADNQQSSQNGQQSDSQQGEPQDGSQQGAQDPPPSGQDAQEQDNAQSGKEGDPSESEQEESSSLTQGEKDKAELKDSAQASQSQDDQSQDDENTASNGQTQGKMTEQEQALNQWMQRIPDNPGGLLENKFRYQYNQRQRADNEEDRKPW